jgi:hypothetical protein
MRQAASMASVSFVRLTVVALVLSLLSGCGRFRKAKECDLLAKTVSAWLARQPAPSAASTEPKKLAIATRTTAARYEELDRELAALDVKSRDLTSRVARYRKIAVQSARALEDAASALERGNVDLARQRRVEFDETMKAESALVAEINSTCRR